MSVKDMKGVWKIGALTAVGVLAFVFALFSVWNDDAIAYSFFIPRVNEDASFEPIHSVADIWASQVNHYFNSNGRFAVHFIVQLFCGPWGKTTFAFCNSIVWILLVYNLAALAAEVCGLRTRNGWLSALLCILMLWYLPFTPPFQVNYVWVCMILTVWLRWFFKRDDTKAVALVFLGLFSLITGQLHEGFSIPAGGAIIAYFIAKRCRLTTRQWVMAVCFGIGALSSILAPGNFYRMNVMEGGRIAGTLQVLASLPNFFIFPFIYLIIIYPWKKRNKVDFKDRDFKIFIFAFILISLIFNLYLKSFDRGLIPYNLAFSILTLIYAGQSNADTPWRRYKIAALTVIALGVIGSSAYRIKMQNDKTNFIIEEYTSSATGRIYLPDNLFLFNLEETCERRNTYTNLLRSRQGSYKPFLVIYPENLKDIDLDKDTNMVIPFGDQSWICIQSATQPADFIVEKTILPGSVNKKMADRVLDFSKGSDIFIDSTVNNRTVVYTNTRPYIKAAIRQAAAHTEE